MISKEMPPSVIQMVLDPVKASSSGEDAGVVGDTGSSGTSMDGAQTPSSGQILTGGSGGTVVLVVAGTVLLVVGVSVVVVGAVVLVVVDAHVFDSHLIQLRSMPPWPLDHVCST